MKSTDIERWFENDTEPTRPRILVAAILSPGFRAVLLFRLQQRFERTFRPLARVAYALNHLLHGIEFLPGCTVGPGLVIRHPTGIVIGRGAHVGRDCTLLQSVTLGERRIDGTGDHAYPTLGDNVVVGAHAIILGAVTIGSGATIGAGSVVLHDVAAGQTVFGAPARPTKERRA